MFANLQLYLWNDYVVVFISSIRKAENCEFYNDNYIRQFTSVFKYTHHTEIMARMKTTTLLEGTINIISEFSR